MRRKTHPILPEHLLDAIARRFRTLGVPSRLRSLNALMDGPLGMAALEFLLAIVLVGFFCTHGREAASLARRTAERIGGSDQGAGRYGGIPSQWPDAEILAGRTQR